MPIEACCSLGWRILLAPKHPSREHAIEKRLDKCRTKEMLALLSLELKAECFFQRRAYSIKRRQLRIFNSSFRVTSIGCEKPSDILWLRQRRGMKHYAL